MALERALGLSGENSKSVCPKDGAGLTPKMRAISGLCSTQISSPVSGSFTLHLSMYFLPSAIAIAVAPNSRSSAISSISLSMASLIRLPRE